MAFDPQRFGRNVAATRTRKGLKPKELAARMGVNPATIYRIERGERADISRPQMEALVRALETSEAELLDHPLSPEDRPDQLAQVLALVEELHGWVRELRDLVEARLAEPSRSQSDDRQAPPEN